MSFASLWDCFLLFCAHTEKSGWWHLAGALYKPSFTKFNDRAIYSFYTMDLRGWIPHARCACRGHDCRDFLAASLRNSPSRSFTPLSLAR